MTKKFLKDYKFVEKLLLKKDLTYLLYIDILWKNVSNQN